MTKEYRHLFFGLVAAVASFFIASSFDVAQAPAMTAAITVFVAWLWITEAVPIPVASLVPFVAFPTFGILTHKQAASALGSHVILLLMGAFILAKGIEKSGVHRRFALNMVKTIGNHSARRIIFAFMITAGTLSIWISNTASTLALLPVALIIAKYSENKRFAIALLLGLAYSASIGGVGSLIGTPPNVIFASVYEEFTGQEYGFLRWMKTGIPVMAIAIPLMALWLSRGIKLDREIAIPDVGVMRTEEKRTLLVFGFTALLWVFRKEPFGGWSGLLDIGTLGDSSVALFGVLLMFVVPAGKPHIQGEKHEKLLDWETAKDIPWGMLLLFAGGIVIAKAFVASGLSQMIGEGLSAISLLPMFAVMLILALSVSFLTEITSNTATATLLMPILASAAVSNNIAIELLMIPAVISCSCAFCLPVATAPNSIVFSSGNITVKDMAREGIMLNIIVAFVVSTVCYLMLT